MNSKEQKIERRAQSHLWKDRQTIRESSLVESMVIIAAAAVTAAGVGAYQGGKAAIRDVGKKIRRRKAMKEHRTEREEDRLAQQRERDEKQAAIASLSHKERIERFKRNRMPSEKQKGLFQRK